MVVEEQGVGREREVGVVQVAVRRIQKQEATQPSPAGTPWSAVPFFGNTLGRFHASRSTLPIGDEGRGGPLNLRGPGP